MAPAPSSRLLTAGFPCELLDNHLRGSLAHTCPTSTIITAIIGIDSGAPGEESRVALATLVSLRVPGAGLKQCRLLAPLPPFSSHLSRLARFS